MKRIKKRIKRLIKKLIIYFFNIPIFKINNQKVIFDNFAGNRFGDSPKYITLELLKQHLDADIVWVLRDLDEELPSPIRKVRFGSLRSYYEFATSKVIVDNIRNSKLYKKKFNQFCIQTWHAPLGMKQVEKKVEKFLDEDYIKDAKMDGIYTDLMVANNDVYYELFKNDFWYKGQVLKIGLPRCDMFFEDTSPYKKKVYEYYNIDPNNRIVFYCPTFRKNIEPETFVFDFYKMISVLNTKYNQNFVMLVRLHPNMVNMNLNIHYDSRIINANSYSDVQEIIAASDVCVTDYSSIMFEFGMQNKPVFLLCKDFQNYISTERNLEFDIKELPFCLSTTESELLNMINSFDLDEYNNRVNSFFDKIGLVRSNKSSYEIYKIIKEQLT